jgi:hypothetical protein
MSFYLAQSFQFGLKHAQARGGIGFYKKRLPRVTNRIGRIDTATTDISCGVNGKGRAEDGTNMFTDGLPHNQ